MLETVIITPALYCSTISVAHNVPLATPSIVAGAVIIFATNHLRESRINDRNKVGIHGGSFFWRVCRVRPGNVTTRPLRNRCPFVIITKSRGLGSETFTRTRLVKQR